MEQDYAEETDIQTKTNDRDWWEANTLAYYENILSSYGFNDFVNITWI